MTTKREIASARTIIIDTSRYVSKDTGRLLCPRDLSYSTSLCRKDLRFSISDALESNFEPLRPIRVSTNYEKKYKFLELWTRSLENDVLEICGHRISKITVSNFRTMLSHTFSSIQRSNLKELVSIFLFVKLVSSTYRSKIARKKRFSCFERLPFCLIAKLVIFANIVRRLRRYT